MKPKSKSSEPLVSSDKPATVRFGQVSENVASSVNNMGLAEAHCLVTAVRLSYIPRDVSFVPAIDACACAGQAK